MRRRVVTFPHTLQERKGPFTCPRCGLVIRFVKDERGDYLEHADVPGAKMDGASTFSAGDAVRVVRGIYKGRVMRVTKVEPSGILRLGLVLVIASDGVEHCNVCTWLDEATDEQVEALK